MGKGIFIKRKNAPYAPARVNTTCPALMFAARRKDRVIGRRIALTVSIRTKKGFNQSGAPEGRRLARKEVGEFETEDKIRANHIGIPSLRVNNRWLEYLNT